MERKLLFFFHYCLSNLGKDLCYRTHVTVIPLECTELITNQLQQTNRFCWLCLFFATITAKSITVGGSSPEGTLHVDERWRYRWWALLDIIIRLSDLIWKCLQMITQHYSFGLGNFCNILQIKDLFEHCMNQFTLMYSSYISVLMTEYIELLILYKHTVKHLFSHG